MVSLVEKYNKYFNFKNNNAANEETSHKFGVFMGVFVPCLLMLFGVIIFLRLGWIVGQVGLATAVFIITMATIITMVSTLSMASIATNIHIGKGGVYYIISRSLGIEIGSAVGIPLFLRQTLTIAFCCVGFAESLHDLIPSWSIQNIGLCTLAILTLLAYASVKGALKIQVLILIILACSFISLFTGGELVSMHPDTFTPPIPYKLGFWAIFAIFFPAMTGMESIVSLSGDLKEPSKSIPIGTILATIVAYLTYTSIAFFVAKHVPIDRLAADPLILQDIASVPSLIILGIWGATLSSAIGALLGAPRTLQAISEDGILPKFLGKTYGPMNEPRIATLVTFAISFAGIYFGSINMIAPLMTMISLVCYGVLNLSAGFETLMANPSWRPKFKVHWAVSIFGAILCLVTMLMIDSGVALIALSIILIIYLIVKKRKFQATWEDIRQGILMFISRYTIYELAYGPSFSKSWRPHFLVFTKTPEEYSHHLLSFSEAISQSKSFLTMASFVSKNNFSIEKMQYLSDMVAKRFKNKNIHALVRINEAEKVTDEMKNMIKYYGLGPLKPNTIVFGGIKDGDEANNFLSVLQSAYQMHYNILIMNDIKYNSVQSGTHSPFDDSEEIHLWWESSQPDNSELMLIFAYMLQNSQAKKKHKICIKSIVVDERARQGKIKQFQELSLKLRLPLDIEVYVTAEPEKELINFVKIFSRDASTTFLSLNPPPQTEECPDAYIEYLNQTAKITNENNTVVLVLSSEHTPLDKILL